MTETHGRSHSQAPDRRGTVRRFALQGLLWAGPLGLALAAPWFVIQLLSAPAGPGTPTAGAADTWTGLWGALGLGVLGWIVGAGANLVWILVGLRAGRRPGPLAWARAGLHVAGLGLLVGWVLS